MLEDRGSDLDTADVARAWLRLLPRALPGPAERAAYTVLMNRMSDEFVNGEEPGFDLAECSNNEYNEWIGAQIRADLYGWSARETRRARRTSRGATHPCPTVARA